MYIIYNLCFGLAVRKFYLYCFYFLLVLKISYLLYILNIVIFKIFGGYCFCFLVFNVGKIFMKCFSIGDKFSRVKLNY